MKKILFFSPYYLPYISGMTTYPANLFKYLKRDFGITVLTFQHQRNLPVEEIINQTRVLRMPFLFRISKGFVSPQSVLYFIKFIQSCDVVIFNLPSVEGWPLAILAKVFGKKIIGIYHCKLFLENNYLAKCIGWIANQLIFLMTLIMDKVVFYTKDYYQSLGQKIDNKAVFCLPPVSKPNVDQKILSGFLKKKNQEKWIGFAGRVSSEKGLEYLVKACEQISKKRSVRLMLVGPYGKDVAGEKNYYHKIKTLLNEAKIKYSFLGSLQGANLGAFYKAIDVLVLPSVNQTEAFGMVQVEAMMLGTPVVVSDLPGVRVPASLSKLGQIVKPKNIDALAKAIAQLINSNQKRSVSMNRFQLLFDPKQVAKFYNLLF